jgi:hypothetical protein
VIPYSEFLPAIVIDTAAKLHKTKFPVIFVDGLPSGVCDGEDTLLGGIKDCPVIPLSELAGAVEKYIKPEICLLPRSNRIRVLHYSAESGLYLIVNEDAAPYTGILTVPGTGNCMESSRSLQSPMHRKA